MDLSISPAYPGAYTDVTVTATSYSADLNRATLTWQIDGKPAESGVGLRSITVETGDLGVKKTVVVLVRPSGESSTFRDEITITPTEVDLVAESNSYIPPTYRGKALFTPGSAVRITALPVFIDGTGKIVPPEKLVYTWQRNFVGVPNASGYGKRTFELPRLKNTAIENISVMVSSLDGELRKERSITVKSTPPKLLFYEDRPLLGTWYNQALGNTVDLKESEITLRGEPFGIVSSVSSTIFEWLVSGEPTEGSPENARLLTFRHEARSGSGNARVTLSGTDTEGLGQKIIGALTIRFTNP